jgi:hypothetical protein
MNTRNEKLVAMIAMGLVGTTAGLANAQTGVIKSPYVINISGATLQDNAFAVNASTNDFIDVDGDLSCGSCPDLTNENLAASQAADNNTNYWNVQYRGVGSINGVIELFNYGKGAGYGYPSASGFVTNADGPIPAVLSSAYCDLARFNRKTYVNLNVVLTGGSDVGNTGNPGAAPVRSDDRKYLDEANSVLNPNYLRSVYAVKNSPGTFDFDPSPAGGSLYSTGGIRIDIAVADVPLSWAITGDNLSAASLFNTPTASGYGRNPAVSKNKQGGSAGAALPSTLGDATALGVKVASVTPQASWVPGNTVFEYQTVYVPIAAVTNYGTGVTQTTVTDLRYGFTTGRRESGENLMFVTRDTGSGTRNGFMNSIGIDPSFGNGENIGGLNGSTNSGAAGEDYLPSNKNGSGALENAVYNSRLAIGTSGAERGWTSNWIRNNSVLDPSRADVLAVKNDHIGGTTYSRPYVDDVLANDKEGYVIFGEAVLATFGDARNNLEIGGDPANTNTAFRVPNPQAAAYVNNWIDSINFFNGNIDSAGNIGSPAEYLSGRFIFTTAPDYSHDVTNPTNLIANASQIAGVRTFTAANSVLKNAPFQNFNATSVGRTPSRRFSPAPTTAYSDGVTTAQNYITKGGTLLPYNSTTVALPARNKISGDFNGDGVRSTADINELVAALKWRTGSNPGWAPLNGIYGAGAGNSICVEIIGDFDADGSFTAADARYFGDGLALYSGSVNRKQAFTDLDNAPLAGGNLFGYAAHSTAEPYKAGDARADIAGKSGYSPTPGFAPVAADNAVTAADIDYVYAQFRKNAKIDYVNGEVADWSDLSKAIFFDLSADMNGDRIVDQNDVDEIVTCVLNTSYTDVNLDGVYDSADDAIVASHYGQTGWGFAGGDTNGDGVVDNLDLCVSDVDRNGSVDLGDFFKFLNDFDQNLCAGNVDGVPGIDLGDFFAFLNSFDQGCNP